MMVGMRRGSVIGDFPLYNNRNDKIQIITHIKLLIIQLQIPYMDNY